MSSESFFRFAVILILILNTLALITNTITTHRDIEQLEKEMRFTRDTSIGTALTQAETKIILNKAVLSEQQKTNQLLEQQLQECKQQ